jgi:hypothetical protein
MLDAAGDRKGANEAFAMYRRLSPKGEFAEDTLARQIDAAIERGDLPLARKLADQYATDFPSGRRLGEIKKQLAGSRAKSPLPLHRILRLRRSGGGTLRRVG